MAHDKDKSPAPAPAAAPSTMAPEPHLFDRLSVLYKYRWATVAVFLAVFGWVMVDSYSSIPMYRADARVLIEDPGADIATPGDMARTPTITDPEIYMQTQLRIMRGRELAQRVAEKLDVKRVPELNGQGPKPTPLAQSIATVKYYAHSLRNAGPDVGKISQITSSASPNSPALARISLEQVPGARQPVFCTTLASIPKPFRQDCGATRLGWTTRRPEQRWPSRLTNCRGGCSPTPLRVITAVCRTAPGRTMAPLTGA